MYKKQEDNKRPAKQPFNKSKPTFIRKTKSTKVASSAAAPEKNVVKKVDKDGKIRLNKYISNSGVCSRREADIYIKSGNVKVNGVTITEMGYMVNLEDVINFDGSVLTPEKKVYVLLNKPKNFTTAAEEGRGSRSVLELVKTASKYKLAPIGKMDKNTTGLLLLTNDHEMLQKMSLPNQKTSKLYQISLDKNLKHEDLEKISKGLVIDGHRTSVEEISYIENEPKCEIGLKMKTLSLRIVRSIFEHLSYDVIKIDRVAFAGLTKKNLPRGEWRFLTEQETINLKNAIK
ncbi:MAG: pseudouridine synthase [Flavobacterium sp.]